jgi:hypothetical protein
MDYFLAGQNYNLGTNWQKTSLPPDSEKIMLLMYYDPVIEE